MNPHGRVPLPEDDGLAIRESRAILRYLAAKYGANRFWSGDPGTRSIAERWMDWSQTTLQPDFLISVFRGYFRTPDAQRDRPAINRGVARCAEHFRLLDALLSTRPFLRGEALTRADIPIATSLYRYFELHIARPAIPNVRAWYERLQQRPACRARVMLAFDEPRGRLAY